MEKWSRITEAMTKLPMRIGVLLLIPLSYWRTIDLYDLDGKPRGKLAKGRLE